jgi:hypothetical protein
MQCAKASTFRGHAGAPIDGGTENVKRERPHIAKVGQRS